MGRQPTSGNCHTCRRRRIACDKTKPCCERCRKSKRHCEGYEKVLRFHNYGTAANVDPGSSRIVRFNKTTSYPVAANNDEDPVVEKSKRRAHRIDSSRPLWTIRPPELSLVSFLDNISFSYFFDSYSWINVHSILLQDTPMRQHFAEDTDDLGFQSLRALSYGLFSRDHLLKNLRCSAERHYGESLRKLRSRLSEASREDLALLAKSIAILGSYSVSSIHVKLSISAPLPIPVPNAHWWSISRVGDFTVC
jgi:hypothetical protein